jgi:hypothetical protein
MNNWPQDLLAAFGFIWSLLGVWVILRALPDVRARLKAGLGTAMDLQRLQKNRVLGICFIAAGMLAVMAALLET